MHPFPPGSGDVIPKWLIAVQLSLAVAGLYALCQLFDTL